MAAQREQLRQPTPLTRNDVPDTATQGNTWLGQYNSHRVVQVLRTKGLTETELAQQAGERVQAQALTRLARRRVREFLKRRDESWGNDETSIVQTATMDYFGQQPSYSFAETVDLLLSHGLTAKDIAEILLHTPGIALMRPYPLLNEQNGESLAETLHRTLTLLLTQTLQLRKYDARKILRQTPGLLTRRGSQSATHIVQVLAKLGVSTSSIARDKSALPQLLQRDPAAVFRLVSFLASDAVRMPLAQIGPLVRRTQCQTLLNRVAPVRTDHNEEHNNNAEAEHPGVVAALWGRASQERRKCINETYRNMTKTAWILRNEIGTVDLGKVVAAYPDILLLDAETQILPAAHYLMNDLGIWKDDLAKTIQLYPVLLGMNIQDMQKVVGFLEALDVDTANMPSMFRSFPSLLAMDVERDMQPTVDFLRSIGIANIGRFVTRLPPVLGYSVEQELVPKWEFLRTVCSDPRFELSRFPAYFSYPLERVIRTRYEYLREVKNIPTQFVPLDHVVRFGDRDFAVKVARDSDESSFLRFLESRQRQARPRHKKKSSKNHKKNDEEGS